MVCPQWKEKSQRWHYIVFTDFDHELAIVGCTPLHGTLSCGWTAESTQSVHVSQSESDIFYREVSA